LKDLWFFAQNSSTKDFPLLQRLKPIIVTSAGRKSKTGKQHFQKVIAKVPARIEITTANTLDLVGDSLNTTHINQKYRL
jgi:hypothetical protein